MFIPKNVVFEEDALKYPLGEELFKRFKREDIDIKVSKRGTVGGSSKDTPSQKFIQGKRTLVVGVRKKQPFQSCKPSAHYQLPLVSGCSAMCEYCYLNTQLGKRPYTKVYVNTDEILNQALDYVEERKPNITIFEGAATSDPIPTEGYTGSLKKAIELFGANEYTLFRFVTKFSEVEPILNLKHNGHTTVRFSINTNRVIKDYEHGTKLFEERLEAARKVKDSGYHLGFIIAPVFLYDGWQEEYKDLIDRMEEKFKGEKVVFEVISHRFTGRAKERILEVYPKTTLPMNEEERKYKYGQFGYGKFVYGKEDLDKMKEFFKENLSKAFGDDSINYII